MAAALDEALDEHAAGAETALAQADDAFKLTKKFRFVAADFHADPAAAGGAFEHDRVADFLRGEDCRFRILQQPGSRNERHTRVACQAAGFVFQAESDDLLRRGAEPFHPGVLAHAGEIGVFTEQAVAGENRVAPEFVAISSSLSLSR